MSLMHEHASQVRRAPFFAFLLLIVLTVGVGYLSLKGWQDDRASKEEVEAFKRGESVGDASAASSGKQGKGPTLSKVGKGFAKRK